MHMNYFIPFAFILSWMPLKRLLIFLSPNRKVIQLYFKKLISTLKFYVIFMKWHSIDVKNYQFFIDAKNSIKFPWFYRFFDKYHLQWIFHKIFNAKILPMTWPFQKGIDHHILSMQRGWKHFPKLFLNELKMHGGLYFCAENVYIYNTVCRVKAYMLTYITHAISFYCCCSVCSTLLSLFHSLSLRSQSPLSLNCFDRSFVCLYKSQWAHVDKFICGPRSGTATAIPYHLIILSLTITLVYCFYRFIGFN